MSKHFADLKRLPTLFGLIGLGLLFIASNLFTDYWLFRHQADQLALNSAHHKAANIEKRMQAYFQRIVNTATAVRKTLQSPQSLGQQQFANIGQSILASNPEFVRLRLIGLNQQTWTVDQNSITIGSPLSVTPNANIALAQPQTPGHGDVWFANLHPVQGSSYVFDVLTQVVIQKQNESLLAITISADALLDNLTQDSLYRIALLNDEGKIIYQNSDDAEHNIQSLEQQAADYIKSQSSHLNASPQTVISDKLFISKITFPNQDSVYLILSLNAPFSEAQQQSFANSAIISSLIGLILITLIYALWRTFYHHLNILFDRQGSTIGELKRINNRAAELLKENRLFLDLASDGIHILDSEGNMVVCSRSFADMLGYSHEEALELNVKDWDAKLPREEITLIMKSFQERPQAFETLHKRKNGSVFDVEVNVRWINSQSGAYFYASARDISDRKALERKLEHIATYDSLTNVLTRREFIRRFRLELERYQRHPDTPLTYAMLDLDDFKAINDQYGHSAGDLVLSSVANVIKTSLRKNDIIGRLGGEELGIVYIGATSDFALASIERIRKRIHDTVILHHQQRIPCTASIGITDVQFSDRKIEDVMERADKALYLAKALGKDRVEAC